MHERSGMPKLRPAPTLPSHIHDSAANSPRPATVNEIPGLMRQARCRQIDSRAGHLMLRCCTISSEMQMTLTRLSRDLISINRRLPDLRSIIDEYENIDCR